MANPTQFVNDMRTLAVELGGVMDRIEAKLQMSASLGGNDEGIGWLQRLADSGPITGDDSEGLTKAELLNLLGTFTTLQGVLNQGHRTNLNRWRW